MRQIGGAAQQPRNILGQRVQHFARRFAGGHALGVCWKAWQILVPSIWQLEILHALELIGELRILLFIIVEFGIPRSASFRSALANAIFEMIVNAIGNQELGVFWPAV